MTSRNTVITKYLNIFKRGSKNKQETDFPMYQNFVVFGVMINSILVLTDGILLSGEFYNMWSVDLFHNHSLKLCPFPEFQEIKKYFPNMRSIEELYTFFVFKSLFRSLLFIMLLLEIFLCKPFFFVMSFATYCKLTIL